MAAGGPVTLVVKGGKRRRSELFDADKLQKSLVAACLASGVPEGYADTTARRVADEVATWLQGKPEVTSSDLRRVAARHMKPYHPDASYLYEHHRSTL